MKIDTFFATFSRKPKKFPHDGCAPPRKGALRPERPVPAGGCAEAALQPLRAIREGLSSGPL